KRVGERHPHLQQVGVLEHGRGRLQEARLVGEAARQVGDQRGAIVGGRGGEGGSDAAHARAPVGAAPRRRATSATSLSPRPERFTTTTCSGAMRGASSSACATAWALSSAGTIPSLRARRSKAASACSSVTATYSAMPASW